MPIPRRVELKKPDGTELSETEREKLRRELDKREVGKLPSMRVLKPLLGDAEASLIRSGEEAHYRIIRDTLKRKKWEARLNIPGLNPDRQADLAEALSSGETRLDKSDRLGLPQRTTPDDVVQFVMSTLTSTAPAGAAWGTTPWSDYRDHVYTTHTAIRRIPDGYAAEIVRVIHGTPRGRPAEVPLSNYAQATENAMKIRHNVGQIHTDREAAAFIDLLRGLGHEPMGGPVPTGIPELVGRTSEGAPSGHQEALSKLEPVDAMHVRALQRPLSQLPKGFMEKEPTQIPNPATPPVPPMIASTSPTAGQYENKIARELFARGYTDQEIQAAADTYTDTTATPLISKVLREGHWGKHCKKYLSVGLAAVLAISGFLGRGCSIRSSRLAEQQRIIRETEEAEKAKTAAAEAAKKTEAEKAKQDAEKKEIGRAHV